MSRQRITTRIYSSSCGELLLGCHAGSLCLCDWLAAPHHERRVAHVQRKLNATMTSGNCPLLQRAVAELDDYFAGKRRTFSLPLLFCGSSFQEKVWRELLLLEYGSCISYAELARRLGNPRATRAVAQANAANVLSLFVPCHRIVGSGGRLGGYSGGLTAKRYLLTREAPPLQLSAVPDSPSAPASPFRGE